MRNSRHQVLNDLIEVNVHPGVPSFVTAHRARGRKGLGLRYEQKVHTGFAQRYGDMYVPSLWFSYRRRSSPKITNFAQPDAFLFDFVQGTITILEVKYNHTADAYFQLYDKYLPLLDKCFNAEKIWTFHLCEIVYWYDKFVDFPCKVSLRDDVTKLRPGEFGVHIWRPS